MSNSASGSPNCSSSLNRPISRRKSHGSSQASPGRSRDGWHAGDLSPIASGHREHFSISAAPTVTYLSACFNGRPRGEFRSIRGGWICLGSWWLWPKSDCATTGTNYSSETPSRGGHPDYLTTFGPNCATSPKNINVITCFVCWANTSGRAESFSLLNTAAAGTHRLGLGWMTISAILALWWSLALPASGTTRN